LTYAAPKSSRETAVGVDPRKDKVLTREALTAIVRIIQEAGI